MDVLESLPSGSLLRLQVDAERARFFAERARAANTRRAYRSDWLDFVSWCEERALNPFPASGETVALYVAGRSESLRVSTLQRRLSAISQAHKLGGFESPASTRNEPLHSVWSGIARTHSRAKHKVAPALPEDLRLMIQHLPRTQPADGLPFPDARLSLAGLRDRAILLIGFSGALRRSEVAALMRDDISFVADGLRLRVRSGKTDQEGHGLTKGILYGDDPLTCPVRALRSWLDAASIVEGAVFRAIDRHGNLGFRGLDSGSVARLVKRAAARAGLDPTQYSGHSLRAGFATQAARMGKHERAIMRHTGHKSERVLREYIREGGLFLENPTEGIGL